MKAQLQNDMKEAMKAKAKVKLSTIRALISAIQYEEMQKGTELKEDQLIAILKNELKKRKESLEYLTKENRQDEIEIIEEEAKVIEGYLPKQLSAEELKQLLIKFKSANASANMGQAMSYLKDNFAGQYDGKDASSLAKEIMV